MEKPKGQGGAGKPEVEPLYTINDAEGVLTHLSPAITKMC